MEIGTTIVYKEQLYELEEFKPHVRQDGQLSELALFRSHCKRCGEPFIAAVPSRDHEPRLASGFSRRCKSHATVR